MDIMIFTALFWFTHTEVKKKCCINVIVFNFVVMTDQKFFKILPVCATLLASVQTVSVSMSNQSSIGQTLLWFSFTLLFSHQLNSN